jgi:hypothetical protein
MRLGSAARVATTATGILAVVYVLGVIVARLAQHNDNRLAGRLTAASHDPDVFSQHAARTFRDAGDGDADSAAAAR